MSSDCKINFFLRFGKTWQEKSLGVVRWIDFRGCFIVFSICPK